MLAQLQLKNWKSYKTSVLEIDQLTMLIGTNASGKSNALDAFVFLNRIASGAMLTSALQGDGALSPMRGGLEWAAQRPGCEFSLGVVCRIDDTMDYEYAIECRISENRCDLVSEKLVRIKYRTRAGKRTTPLSTGIGLFTTDPCTDDSPNITARLYNEKRGSPRPVGRAHSILFQLAGQNLRQEIKDGVLAVLSSLKEIFYLDPIPSHMRAYSPLSEKLDSDAKNIAGVIAALPEYKRQEIETVLTSYASKLPEKDIRRVYAETVGKFKSDAMLYCEEDWLGNGEVHTVDARGMSDGTLRFLAILTALLTRPADSLLIIEEIDNGLHPSRASMLLEMLSSIGKKQGVDVLATTHNPALLDAAGTKMIPFITVAHRDKQSGHSVLTLLEDISDLPKLLAQGSIGKLSSKGLIERALQYSFDFDESSESAHA